MSPWAAGMMGLDPAKCPIFITDVELLAQGGDPRAGGVPPARPPLQPRFRWLTSAVGIHR